jgi:hypothetical protein
MTNIWPAPVEKDKERRRYEQKIKYERGNLRYKPPHNRVGVRGWVGGFLFFDESFFFDSFFWKNKIASQNSKSQRRR